MANVSLSNLRVLQVSEPKPIVNEQTQGSFTVFNIDVECTTSNLKDGLYVSKLIYHRLERVIGGNATECDIRPGMYINAFADLEGYWFKDPQTGESRAVNRLKITGWQAIV